MDKKEAEQETLRKAKEAQNAAGKNVGMSGRDLVSWIPHTYFCMDMKFILLQFQYNPEWFQDEEEDDSDDWDLAQYRRQKEEEDLAEEEARIANLTLQDSGGH